jgi:hypothetical protein
MTIEERGKEGSQETSGASQHSNTSQHSGSYRVYISKDRLKPVKLPDIKRWVSDWTEEFGAPPREIYLSHTVINQRTIDRLHELGVTIVRPMGGVLAWEVHIGLVP